MIVYSDDPIRRFRWKFMLLVEAEPRVWWSAAVVAVLTGCAAWRILSPAWAAALSQWHALTVAAPLAAAASTAAAGGIAGWWVLTTVAKLDSPTTPFPIYHLRVLWDEASTPRPTTIKVRTIKMLPPPNPHNPTTVTRHAVDDLASRSPHVCCPHDREAPQPDPLVAAGQALTRVLRRVLRRR